MEELFVPGRICLFGEHSDWAGSYRRMNSEIERGYTIITGTNQGLFAKAQTHPDTFIYRATLDGGEVREFTCPMERDALLDEACAGSFFSYAAGVAYQVLVHHKVGGLEIDNYRTTLPLQKGLSSSAAACVLVARAFDWAYDLKLTVRGEMEYAYRGEITTPSRCGRMDQGCAYGSRPVLMIFDGDVVDVQPLSVGADLFLVIVDLQAGKDTVKILARLNEAYPFASDEAHHTVQEHLGPMNSILIEQARHALEAGDPARVGRLMRESQDSFDRCLRPMCPSELDAPVLHKVLSYEPIQQYIHGGKCVGSGGDGSGQLIARDEAAQKKVMQILQDELGMPSLELTIHATEQ